jgi:tetratricopeptide (TPR) repeat protein
MRKDRRKLRRLAQAEEHFFQGAYREAMHDYAMLLSDDPTMPEARIGAKLTDIAMENDEQAQALFEYYQLLKRENRDDAENVIEEIIDSMDDTIEKITELFESLGVGEPDTADGISYQEFKELVADRGDFRRAFEDIMFSTRVVISEKEDLLDFMQLLVEHGFDEMAIRYIESFALSFPDEERIVQLMEKLKDRT